MLKSSEALSLLRASRAVVFVNLTAGGGRARASAQRIRELFEASGAPAEFVATNSAAELETAAQAAISRGQRVLFAMGGDGTFQALANASQGSDACLGILPAGGGNDFAAALGMPADPLRAAEAVLQGRTRSVDLVRVRTADGRTRLYAGGGGIGLDAQAARHATGTYRHLPGRVRYVAAALRALLEFEPLSVRLEFPETDLCPVEMSCLLTGVLNSPTYGAGVRLAPEATIDDGFLHVVQIENMGTLGVLRLLPRLMLSGEVRTTRIQRWRVRRVRLSTEQPYLFHGDGEILGLTPVEIEIVPRAIRILALASR